MNALIGEKGPEAVIPLDRFERNNFSNREIFKVVSDGIQHGLAKAQIYIGEQKVSSAIQTANILNQREISI